MKTQNQQALCVFTFSKSYFYVYSGASLTELAPSSAANGELELELDMLSAEGVHRKPPSSREQRYPEHLESPYAVQILEDTSTRNPREALVETNAADSVTIPPTHHAHEDDNQERQEARAERGGLGHDSTERITLTRTTTKNVKKLVQLHACHASRGSSRTQPDVVDDENHVLEGEEPEVRPIET
eukprot:CAMPEP_0172645656 /NCGR_PEP_ID=MMETSP1068-20121228/239839_1 /TAXON_ID=35684 /ORGANISM="Pseudopedinella elastica, Strain CCMP716" /LENGTH=184 /DNA_ID=CAMNT_0013459899 /DNA_START=32 /DNA_END=588 /DNA_ORIENTATION=-